MSFVEKIREVWREFLAQNEEDARHLHEDGRLDCCTMNRPKEDGPPPPRQ